MGTSSTYAPLGRFTSLFCRLHHVALMAQRHQIVQVVMASVPVSSTLSRLRVMHLQIVHAAALPTREVAPHRGPTSDIPIVVLTIGFGAAASRAFVTEISRAVECATTRTTHATIRPPVGSLAD